jgi:hypothetical protein
MAAAKESVLAELAAKVDHLASQLSTLKITVAAFDREIDIRKADVLISQTNEKIRELDRALMQARGLITQADEAG